MSIARFVNGRLLSKIQMVATNREEQILNAKKAFSILGPVKIKSKVRIITKGPDGGDGGGNGDDGNYNDGPCFGSVMGYVGLGVNALANSETIMIVLDDGWSNLSTREKLELVSLGLQGVGLAASALVPVIGPPLGVAIGSVGTIVGIVSLGLNHNMDSLIRINVGYNLSFTVYVV